MPADATSRAREAPVGRIVAIGLLAAVLALVGGLSWAPMMLLDRQAATLRALDAESARLRARFDARERALAEERVLARRGAIDALLFDAPTPAIAAADVQTVLTDLVIADGGQISSIEVAAPVRRDRYVEVAVDLTARKPLDGLLRLMHALETMVPVMLVERIDIYADPSAAPEDPLTAGMRVVVFTDAEEPA